MYLPDLLMKAQLFQPLLLKLVSCIYVMMFAGFYIAQGQDITQSNDPIIKGTWLGKLQAGGVELRIVFHVSADSAGILSATMDSPDQGALGIPISEVSFEDGNVRFGLPDIGGVYEGTHSDDGTTFDGTWQQSGMTFPLTLTRTDEVQQVNRPQEPEEPFPYDVEEVRYRNDAADLTLAGTLTLPPSEGPFAAVLLISGSGPQDRNEALLGHKPFLILADYLTRHGIAVLRYDDRGVAESTGNFATATSKDFAGDARAGVTFLKQHQRINPDQIGLIGHSEGGMIAPMIAAESDEVAFIVLLAGTGITGEEILYLQSRLINRANGAGDETIRKNNDLQKRLFTIIKETSDPSTAAEQLNAFVTTYMEEVTPAELEALGLTEASLRGQVAQVNTPWFRFFLTYDPAPALEKVTVPVLAINGEKDLQVPPAENLGAIERALKAGGNINYMIQELPGLNHLFQTATTGSPNEYSGIEETMAPATLELIVSWIEKEIIEGE